VLLDRFETLKVGSLMGTVKEKDVKKTVAIQSLLLLLSLDLRDQTGESHAFRLRAP
jgi:hypothetical protein